MTTDQVLARVHARLDETEQERRAVLRDLIRIDSATGSEQRIQQELAGRLRQRGFTVDVQPIDEAAARQIAPAGMEPPVIGGPNLLATLPGSGAGRSLLLNGHCDTVPAGSADDWSVPPLSAVVRDGAMWGRGSCDTKAGLAAAMCAMFAIQDVGLRLSGDVSLLSTVGEEAGMPGALSFAARGPSYDAAVVTEPTGLVVAPAHAGFAHGRIQLRGMGAHASVRDEGVSAIEKFCDLVQTLREFESHRNESLAARGLIDPRLYSGVTNPAPVNVGVVQGGTSSATVAEKVTCLVRLGCVAGEDLALAKQAFDEHVARWASRDSWLRDNPPEVEWSGAQVPGGQVPPDSPIVEAVSQSVGSVLGQASTLRAMPFGAEMVHLIGAGIPTVMFGPGHATHAHRIDERVSLREYDVATHVLAETIVRWCGAD